MKRLLTLMLVLLVPTTLAIGACGGGSGSSGDGSDDGNGSGGSATGTSDVGAGDVDQGGDGGTVDDATDNNGGGDECEIDEPRKIAGTLATHPVTDAIDSETTLGDIELSLHPGLAVVGSGAEAKVLSVPTGSGTPTDERACPEARTTLSSDGTSVDYVFEDVDIGDVGVGMVSIIDDAEGADDNFFKTATGLATKEDLDAMDLTDGSSFAVSNATIEKFADLTSKSLSKLTEEGIALGRVVDADGNPLSDYKVGVVQGDSISPFDDALYPSADYSDATTGEEGGSTSENGVFFLSNKELTSFGATKSDDNSIDTSTQQAATSEGLVFTLELTEASSEN